MHKPDALLVYEGREGAKCACRPDCDDGEKVDRTSWMPSSAYKCAASQAEDVGSYKIDDAVLKFVGYSQSARHRRGTVSDKDFAPHALPLKHYCLREAIG